MTTLAIPAVTGQSRTARLIGIGALLGLAYTLSPLTVLSLGALTAAAIAAGRGLSSAERRWYWSILSISVAIRLIPIALLFYTANPAHPFASFLGDEELYKFRTIWLRNIGQHIPMSPADVIYSFDAVGHTRYIYVLAFVQALFGDAPYALHVFSMTMYLSGVLGLYRVVRRSYGGVVAMGGLIALLCLPSLALWSISVLKEPMNVLMLAIELIAAVTIVRAPRWSQKAIALVVVIGAASVMESLREGSALIAAFGTSVGIVLSFALSKGRRLAVVMMVAPLVIIAIASAPPVQDRLLSNLRRAAFYHSGHVLTFGYSYQLLSPRYYADRIMVLNHLPAQDAARFAAKGVWSYFVQPLPWEMRSKTMLAYLPEQMAWYFAVLLLPFGIYAGLKRDVVLTAMLASHAAGAILVIALSSGNIGTLIRHRALALPYLLWLSATGAHEIVRRIAAPRVIPDQRSGSDGDR